MMQAFRTNIARLPQFAGAGFSDEDAEQMRVAAREKLEAMASAARGPLCVLSAEEISSFDEAELEEMRRFLAPLFDAIEIFLYVRPLKERMESAFQEVLKTRYQSLEKRFSLNYMGLARNFDAVFGEDRVHFFEFSRERFPGGSVVAHFLQAAGANVQTSENMTRNERLSKEAVQLLYAYRLLFPQQQEGEEALLDNLATLGSTPFHFHSELYHKLLHTGPNAARNFSERAGFSVDEDIERHDSLAIRGEDDLLDFPRESIRWLSRQLPLRENLKLRLFSSKENVARAMDSLRGLT
jgi:hypothetical protein